MTHFDRAAINLAGTTYVMEIKKINEQTARERARTRKIVNGLRVASVALNYVAAFCDGFVDATKR